ncbi:MAG TPA: Zn-ribbon domain-containing OB-fold protein [Streptosporangiaceae bacterium]|nr:Zn-ribbon domain-containing OB-fold protein [Streptosporangiaceae bacterium]
MAEQAGQQLERPLPMFPEPDTEPFWAATAEHRLAYQVCLACGQVVFHPRRHCTGCLDNELEWRDSAGLGTLYTFTVIRQNGQPFFRARLPYVVGFVDLDEGFRMLAEIAADPDSVHVDQRVTLTWEDHSGLSVPLFVPLA